MMYFHPKTDYLAWERRYRRAARRVRLIKFAAAGVVVACVGVLGWLHAL